MPRLKIIQSGFTTLTGPLHNVDFINGLSGVLSLLDIRRVAANIACDLYEDDGTTRISQAGEAAAMVGVVTRGAQPTGIAAETARIDVEDLIIKPVAASTYTLIEADNGKLLDFSAGCVITVPSSLSADFGCSLRQGGASQITVAGGAGVTVEEIDSHFKSEKRLATLTVARFPDGTFQLSGRTVA